MCSTSHVFLYPKSLYYTLWMVFRVKILILWGLIFLLLPFSFLNLQTFNIHKVKNLWRFHDTNKITYSIKMSQLIDLCRFRRHVKGMQWLHGCLQSQLVAEAYREGRLLWTICGVSDTYSHLGSANKVRWGLFRPHFIPSRIIACKQIWSCYRFRHPCYSWESCLLYYICSWLGGSKSRERGT